ncbi:hypothetical protein QBC35DRAFT_244689 [Podospora australis]|uniref:Uncharacterized protein n=1 Tax=Podospora australis TaxID=1536484 RepID=A0AAN6X1P3_9PEZI|nr:hypothetical protein QBC35DRAFT_244689 [Podospora australis]
MHVTRFLFLALASVTALVLAQDVLFPYMHGLKYREYDEAKKLGLNPHVCKDEDEWNRMTTSDFAKYKAIIVPDCLCNTSLNTIKFLDDTKKVWSPAVTGNMVLIGTDPSYHARWYNLSGAYAMMKDSIALVSTGKNGTGMYFSLSCYYQSRALPTTIEALSEIGDFKIRGNLTCLNNAHIVATDESMTSLNDKIASNWNCSVHEVFAEYPTTGSGAFEPLAIALNTTGIGQRTFADNTSGIPYIIARGVTPMGCGDNITDTAYNEECDYGKLNGALDSPCSSSCKCLFGVVSPGVCRLHTALSSLSSSTTYSSTTFTNSSTLAPSTSSYANSSLTSSLLYSNSSTYPTSTRSRRPPVTITVYPSRPPYTSTPRPTSNVTTSDDPDPPAITSTVDGPSDSVSVTASPPDTSPGTVAVTASDESGTGSSSTLKTETEEMPGTVEVTASGDSGAGSSLAPTEPAPTTIVVTASGGPSAGPSSAYPPETTPGTVLVTASDDFGSGSPSVSPTETAPGTVVVTASGEPGMPSSLSRSDTSQLLTASESTSESVSESSPGTVVVTASGNPGTGLLSYATSNSPSMSASVSSPVSDTVSDTDPGTVIVTASADPGTVVVTASGNSGTSSPSYATSDSPLMSSPASGPSSDNAPSTVIVTVSAGPEGSSTQSSPVTVTIQPSGSPPGSSGLGSSSVTDKSASASQSQFATPPATVTVGGPHNSVPASIVQSLSGTIAEGSMSVSAITPSQSSDTQTRVTITMQPSGQPSKSPGMPGASISSIRGWSSSLAAMSVSSSGSAPSTVTVLPPAQSASTLSAPGNGSGDGLGSQSSSVSRVSTKTLTITPSVIPATTRSTYPSSGTAILGSGQPGMSSGMSHSTQAGSSGYESGGTSRSSSEINTADPLGGSLGSLSGTASSSAPGSLVTSRSYSEINTADPLGGSLGSLSGTASSSPPGSVVSPSSTEPSQSWMMPSGIVSSTPSSEMVSSTASGRPSARPSDSGLASGTALPSGTLNTTSAGLTSVVSSGQISGTPVSSNTLPGSYSAPSVSHTYSVSGVGSGTSKPTNVTATEIPLPSFSQCGAWIGVEIIYLVEVTVTTEICPDDGSTGILFLLQSLI